MTTTTTFPEARQVARTNPPAPPVNFPPLHQRTLQAVVARLQNELSAPVDIVGAFISAEYQPATMQYTNRKEQTAVGNVFCVGWNNEILAWVGLDFGRLIISYTEPLQLPALLLSEVGAC